MWLLAALTCFVAAILLNAVVARVTPLPPLASFLATGTVVGIGLVVVAFRTFELVDAFAAILLYAAACELFLIVMTTLVSSIAVRSIRLLGRGPMSAAALAALYDETDMVHLRLDRLAATGFAETDGTAWRLTSKGAALLAVLRRLRRLFGHAETM